MFFSIIIPCPKINLNFEKETIPAILKQKGVDFEIIIIPDKKTSKSFPKTKIFPLAGLPAQKRNHGLEKARGEVVVFIDDDAYPEKNWLKNIAQNFKNNTEIIGVGGPGLTPPNDPFLAQASGWFWASPLGSGGAGQYRSWPQKKRLVDDYPTFNLAIKKKALDEIGGFNYQFWPGEDTKLCLDLVYRLKGKIFYQPKAVVFHHRRKIFIPHLKQIGRFGYHRGLFVNLFPKTSRRIGYFLPFFFSAGFFGGPVFYLIFFLLKLSLLTKIIGVIYLSVIGVYSLGLLFNALWVFLKSKSILIALLVIPTVFVSHLFYGIMFFKGLTRKVVKSKFSREG